jgi:hypothetical protein
MPHKYRQAQLRKCMTSGSSSGPLLKGEGFNNF